MRVVVTLDDNGQVEVYATENVEVVLIDNSVPEDAGDYREETITTVDGQYVITGAVYKMEGPHKDAEFVRKVFSLADEEREEGWQSCSRSPNGRHVRDGDSCRYCGTLLKDPEAIEDEEEELPDFSGKRVRHRPEE